MRTGKALFRASVPCQQVTETVDAVAYAASAERTPVPRRVDRNHRFSEPFFGFGGQRSHDESGSYLHDRIRPGAIDIQNRLAQLIARDMGNPDRCVDVETVQLGDFVPGLRKIRSHPLVTQRLVGRDERKGPGMPLSFSSAARIAFESIDI